MFRPGMKRPILSGLSSAKKPRSHWMKLRKLQIFVPAPKPAKEKPSFSASRNLSRTFSARARASDAKFRI